MHAYMHQFYQHVMCHFWHNFVVFQYNLVFDSSLLFNCYTIYENFQIINFLRSLKSLNFQQHLQYVTIIIILVITISLALAQRISYEMWNFSWKTSTKTWWISFPICKQTPLKFYNIKQLSLIVLHFHFRFR